MSRYRSVDPKVSFPALEREVIAKWKAGRVFERSLEQREGASEWVFYEGPPTANGMPHPGHCSCDWPVGASPGSLTSGMERSFQGEAGEHIHEEPPDRLRGFVRDADDLLVRDLFTERAAGA